MEDMLDIAQERVSVLRARRDATQERIQKLKDTFDRLQDGLARSYSRGVPGGKGESLPHIAHAAAEELIGHLRQRRDNLVEQIGSLEANHDQLQDAVADIEAYIEGLATASPAGEPNLSDALDLSGGWNGSASIYHGMMQRMGLALTKRTTSRGQRVVALDMLKDDAESLQRTLGGMRDLVGYYHPPLRSRYLQFAIVDHTDGADEPELRVRVDLSDPIVLAGGQMLQFDCLEDALSHVQQHYGAPRMDTALAPKF